MQSLHAASDLQTWPMPPRPLTSPSRRFYPPRLDHDGDEALFHDWAKWPPFLTIWERPGTMTRQSEAPLAWTRGRHMDMASR